MRILIAEDEHISRRLLESTLAKWGYDMVVARDGIEAWDALQKDDAPSLAILDWMMPGMDGVDICRQIRSKMEEPYTYILLLTARRQKQDLVLGMDAGADDYITKPFDVHELKVRIHAGIRILELQNELIAAREALRVQATHDSLTGLYNRPAIMDALSSEISRTTMEQTSVGVMMVDLDHYKEITDTYGHIAGDMVLAEASSRIKDACRPQDIVGRYAGDEFVIVMPDTEIQEVALTADEIRRRIGDEPFLVKGMEMNISASFGAAEGKPGSPENPETLIEQADEAAYEAKSLGRNRVCSFNPGTQSRLGTAKRLEAA